MWINPNPDCGGQSKQYSAECKSFTSSVSMLTLTTEQIPAQADPQLQQIAQTYVLQYVKWCLLTCLQQLVVLNNDVVNP